MQEEELELYSYHHQQFLAETSLHEFIKQAWLSVEGGVPFVDNWHIEAIAEHLEACYRREIKNLLINIPPRSAKTTLISVAFPAWVWLHNPEEKFMYASYASSLAVEHSLKCRRLIESAWYQNNWGEDVILARDQRAKSFFENTRKGYRISTSVGASSTGKGGSMLICDDPNNAKESDIQRENTNKWWSQVWSSRLNNPKNDVRIVVQQRTHENDISGTILNSDKDSDWVKLILPMEFEEKRRCHTIPLPSTEGEIWEDPRVRNGQLLWQGRFADKEIARYKSDLGSYGYAGQYQQRPAPEEGGIIKKDWFKIWNGSLPKFELVVQSWDTALTANDSSAYSACTTWGVFLDNNYNENLLMLSMWRGKVEYPELRKRVKRLHEDYLDINISPPKICYNERNVDLCLVEAKASGDPLIQDMRAVGIDAIGFNPTKYGDKIQRVRLVTPIIEAGKVWLQSVNTNSKQLKPFCDEFLNEATTFPNSSSRDLVDTMTQCLLRLKAGGYLNKKHEVSHNEDYNNIKY